MTFDCFSKMNLPGTQSMDSFLQQISIVSDTDLAARELDKKEAKIDALMEFTFQYGKINKQHKLKDVMRPDWKRSQQE